MEDRVIFGVWSWNEFIGWYGSLPISGQILFIIAIFAAISLLFVGLYYLIKGCIYLIYYILLGVAYLLYGIFLAFYKLFEALYYGITGKPRPLKNKESRFKFHKKRISNIMESPVVKTIPKDTNLYCTECGNKYTDSMKQLLATEGMTFCSYCGKGFKAQIIEVQN